MSVRVADVCDSAAPSTEQSSTCSLYFGRALGVMSVVGCLVLVIFGSITPHLVESTIREGTLRAVQLNPNTRTPESWSTYINRTSFQDFYLYNLTNLREVLQSGSAVQLDEVGPFRFQRTDAKFNVSFEDDAHVVRFKTYVEYTYLGGPMEMSLDAPMIAVNPFYLGGMALSARSATLASGTSTRTPWNVSLNDATFHIAFLSTNVLEQLRGLFLDPSQKLLQALRRLLVPVYLAAAQTYAQTVLNVSAADVWSRHLSDASLLSVSDPAGFSGFELQGVLSSDAVVHRVLWNVTHPFSLLSSDGIQSWISGNMLVTSIEPALTSGDIAAVTRWINLVVYEPGFESTVCASFRRQFTSLVRLSPILAAEFSESVVLEEYLPHNFTEMGALQFGSGLLLATLLTPTSLLATGRGLSLVNVPLNQQIIGLQGAFTCEFFAGVEYFASFIEPSADPAMHTYVAELLAPVHGTARLTIQQSLQLLQKLASAPTTFGMALQISKVASLQLRQTLQVNSNTSNARLAVEQVLRTMGATNPVVDQLGLSASNVYAWYAYLSGYLGHELTGFSGHQHADGIAPQNSGLFTRQSIGDMLFGFNAKYAALGGVVSAGPIINGFTKPQKSRQQWIDDAYVAQRDVDSAQFTGMGESDAASVSRWREYQGQRSLYERCHTLPQSSCSPTAIGNWEIWPSPGLLIGGASDGYQTTPMRHNQDVLPGTGVDVFVPELYRPVAFHRGLGDVEKLVPVRGIPSIQLAPTRDFLMGQTVDRSLEEYNQQNVPDGLFELRSALGGMPAFASLPHFGPPEMRDAQLLVPYNTSVARTRAALHFDVERHSTWLRVEPWTGLTVQASKRLQSNFRLRKQELTFNGEYARLFALSDTVYVPYYWSEQYNIISVDDAATLQSKLDDIAQGRAQAKVMQITMLFIGIFGLFTACSVFAWRIYLGRTNTQMHSTVPQ